MVQDPGPWCPVAEGGSVPPPTADGLHSAPSKDTPLAPIDLHHLRVQWSYEAALSPRIRAVPDAMVPGPTQGILSVRFEETSASSKAAREAQR